MRVHLLCVLRRLAFGGKLWNKSANIVRNLLTDITRSNAIVRSPDQHHLIELRGQVLVWAIATLLVNREVAGVAAMVRAGLREFYFPRILSPRPCALFPGYAFIRPVDAWRPILSAAHVTGVLGVGRNGGQPIFVKNEIIDEIRGREKNGFVKLPPPFPKKARVRVHRHTSAFFEAEGICDGMRGQDRVCVLLSILGRESRVEFQKADLILA